MADAVSPRWLQQYMMQSAACSITHCWHTDRRTLPSLKAYTFWQWGGRLKNLGSVYPAPP